MDTANTLIGVVTTLCCGIPFFLMYISKKKKTQQKTQIFKTIAQDNGLSINKVDIFNHLSFGIDTNKKIALLSNSSTHKIVDLKNCEGAAIDIKKKRINKTTEQITDVILNFKIVNNDIVGFNIFNSDVNRLINGEIEVGQKWTNTINQCIKQ